MNRYEYLNDLKAKSQKGHQELLNVLKHYDEYIIDKERLLNEIIYKIDEYFYDNQGTEIKDKYKYNVHTIGINSFEFKFDTGIGINCQADELAGFEQETIIFDAILSLIFDAHLVCGHDMDSFLEEMGYTDSLASVRKGEEIYRKIKENNQKLYQIFDSKTIEDIYEIIEL